MSVKTSPPFSFYVTSSGLPLQAGKIYIGQANLDPVTHPTTVYSDAALTTTVAQPIATLAGVPVNGSGVPINMFVAGNYSIAVYDKNGLPVYSAPSAVLNGGDITLASGETLEAQSGATVDFKSGSTLQLGGSDGAGVSIVVSSPTRVTGNWIPAATGQDLGSATNLWDAFLRLVVLSTSILPSVAAVPVLGSLTLPFANVVSRLVQARALMATGNDLPASTSDLLKHTQRDCILVACNQTSDTSVAAFDSAKNVSSIVRGGSAGQYTVTFTHSINGGGSSPVWVALCSARQQTVNFVNVTALPGSTNCVVRTDVGGVPTDAAWSLVIIGYPAVTDPIS